MEINITYSKKQLECAVNFIAKHNSSFKNNHNEIRNSILNSMEHLAKDENLSSIGTMGYLLTCDFQRESMDCDQNICTIDINVDPSLGVEIFDESDYECKIINT